MTDLMETHAEQIISTAKLGEELSINLVKFSAQFNDNHLMILNLSSGIGLISGNLYTLSETISKYGPNVHFDDSLTKPLVGGLRAIFEKVQKALNEAVEAENAHGDDVELEVVNGLPERRNPRRPKHAGCIAFEKVFGGYGQAEALVWYLETQKSHVFYLARGIKYLALKKMEEENSLEAEQKRALNKLEKESLQLLRELGWRKFALGVIIEKWKAGEDMTVAGRLRADDDFEIVPRRRDVDFDARSFNSISSVASDFYIDEKVIYERWLIRRFETYIRGATRHWSLFGLKFHEVNDNDSFSAEPIPCSQDELKSKYDLAKTGGTSDSIKKMVEKLPAWVHREIECLVNERTRNSKAPNLIRTWSLLDAFPAPPVIPTKPTGGWLGLFKSEPEPTGWIVVLKVESSDAEGMLCQNGVGDPFRKYRVQPFMDRREIPAYRRERDYSPVREREREVVIEPRRNSRFAHRAEVPVPSAEETHERIKKVMDGILTLGKETAKDNPFISAEEVAS